MDNRDEKLREVMRNVVPLGRIRWQGFGGRAEASRERGAADKSFDAVAMESAGTSKGISRRAAGEDMSDLRVESAMDRATIDQHASSKTGSDRQINETGAALPCSPTVLGQSGGVDVSVDGDRAVQSIAEPFKYTRAGPPSFGSRQDSAVILELSVEAHRPEASNPKAV